MRQSSYDTVFYTSDPDNRHSQNSVSTLDTTHSAFWHKSCTLGYCFDLFYLLGTLCFEKDVVVSLSYIILAAAWRRTPFPGKTLKAKSRKV